MTEKPPAPSDEELRDIYYEIAIADLHRMTN